jgi:hypothetical protein
MVIRGPAVASCLGELGEHEESIGAHGVNAA